MSARRSALVFLGLASPVLVLTCFVASPAAELVFTVLVAAFPVALIALGAGHRGRLGGLMGPLLGLLLLLSGSLVGMLLLRGAVASEEWIAGLPAALALQIFGLFLLPLVLVTLAYGLGFRRQGLRQEDLDALRRRFPPPGES